MRFWISTLINVVLCMPTLGRAQERRKIRISNGTGIGNFIRAIKAEGRFADRNIAYEEVAEPRFAIEVAKELGYKLP